MKIINFKDNENFFSSFLTKESFIKEIKNYDFTNKSVLSLGCGEGRWERIIKDTYKVEKIVGIDANPEIIEKASYENRDITFKVMNYFNLSSSFVELFDCILWIPGPLNRELLIFLKDNFLSLKKKKIDILLWPQNVSYFTFLLSDFTKYLDKIKCSEYKSNFYLSKIDVPFSYISDEEYYTGISNIVEDICNIQKCGRFILLSNLNNSLLEKTFLSQKEILKLEKIKDNMSKLNLNINRRT